MAYWLDGSFEPPPCGKNNACLLKEASLLNWILLATPNMAFCMLGTPNMAFCILHGDPWDEGCRTSCQ